MCGREGAEGCLDGADSGGEVGGLGEGFEEGVHGVGGEFPDGEEEVSDEV